MRRFLLPPLAALATLPLLATAAAQGGTVDLRLVMTDFEEHERPQAGDLVSYSLNVTNLGTGNATGIVLVDRFPEGFEFVGGAPGCEETAPRVVTCPGEDLGPGDLFAYLLTFRATTGGTFVNEGEVSSAATDTDPSNNVDDETTTVGQPKEAPPDDPRCEATEDGVRVSWGAVDGAEEYRVHRATGDGAPAFLATTTETSHLDGTADPETAYRYHVTVVTASGESGPSAPCEVAGIPFFPGAFPLALAGAGAVGAYVALRRRG